MKNKKYYGISALVLFVFGIFFHETGIGSILVIVSAVLFALWLFTSIKNRLTAGLILVITVAVLSMLLPIIRQYF